jgi:hypothetical protein
MAYDTIAQAAPAGAITSPAEVMIHRTAVASTDLYTVPDGKVFKGYLVYQEAGAARCRIKDNGSSTYVTFNFGYSSTGSDTRWPIFLNAGDVISGDGSLANWMLMGIETTVNTVSWDTSG